MIVYGIVSSYVCSKAPQTEKTITRLAATSKGKSSTSRNKKLSNLSIGLTDDNSKQPYQCY